MARCSDGFEFACWDRATVRGAFIIDACDREVIAWRAVANAGISGADVQDMLLEAVEAHFGGVPSDPARRGVLSDECELVSGWADVLFVSGRRASATRPERRCGPACRCLGW
jgi:transposase InsO family protein